MEFNTVNTGYLRLAIVHRKENNPKYMGKEAASKLIYLKILSFEWKEKINLSDKIFMETF